ncbi:MAG: cell wall hydrolase [Sphingomonas sp.]|nr:cell wall hydrolase [Sphingomonas sp.]
MLMARFSAEPGRPARASQRLLVLLGAIAVLAVLVPVLIVAFVPRPRPTAPARAVAARARPQPGIVPPTTLPPVEPLEVRPLSPVEAVAFNAAIPFSTAPNPAARPFRAPETGDSLARAIDCLAAAALYEAGDDAPGERAVAQVVLNRVRHPAFPKTVCGVVFEGSDRVTGCQFTFTCDGALYRHQFSDAAWTRAREIAKAALTGAVYKPVGHATHYHTNWVVPYWQASLDKVSAVGTHLFFRWSGWWGTPPAFNRQVSRDEPAIKLIAAYSPAHRMALGVTADAALPEAASESMDVFPAVEDHPNEFILGLARGAPGEDLPVLADKACGARPYCKVMIWVGDKAPDGLPLTTSEISRMAFSYLRDRGTGFDKKLWNCKRYLRPDAQQCMRAQILTETNGLLMGKPELLVPRPELTPEAKERFSTRVMPAGSGDKQ